MNVDPNGNFFISLAVLGLIIGATVGATAGGIIAYNVAKDNGAEGWELFGWTMAGIVGGGIVGGALGYGLGAIATHLTGISGLSFIKGNVFVVTKTIAIGHFPGYTATGYGYYQISKQLYDSMTPAQQWAMNAEYLDDCMSAGASFFVEPNRAIEATSWLYSEIQYLIDNGYKWLEDLSGLIR